MLRQGHWRRSGRPGQCRVLRVARDPARKLAGTRNPTSMFIFSPLVADSEFVDDLGGPTRASGGEWGQWAGNFFPSSPCPRAVRTSPPDRPAKQNLQGTDQHTGSDAHAKYDIFFICPFTLNQWDIILTTVCCAYCNLDSWRQDSQERNLQWRENGRTRSLATPEPEPSIAFVADSRQSKKLAQNPQSHRSSY